MTKITAAVVTALIGLILPMQLALAGGGAAIGPLSELTGEWWRWAYSIPTGQNPQLDQTGQYCMVGNAAVFGFWQEFWWRGRDDPRVLVPEGKALFFPVINSFWNNTPSTNSDCGQSGRIINVRTLISYIKTTGIDPLTIFR